MELLWPERDPVAAANNLHQALYVARRALAAAGADASTVLPLREDMLVLAPDGGVEVDVDVFETAVARARETGTLVDHLGALRCYHGELLPEDRFESWAASRREAVGEAYRRPAGRCRGVARSCRRCGGRYGGASAGAAR